MTKAAIGWPVSSYRPDRQSGPTGNLEAAVGLL
jgi:hypothetical protein